MRDYELTAKEIMCVAASLGATELYGIPDGFSGISKSSLNKELLKVQSSLEQKGYLKANFDGETSLSKEIIDVITVCSKCEKFIAIDKQIKNKTPRIKLKIPGIMPSTGKCLMSALMPKIIITIPWITKYTPRIISSATSEPKGYATNTIPSTNASMDVIITYVLMPFKTFFILYTSFLLVIVSYQLSGDLSIFRPFFKLVFPLFSPHTPLLLSFSDRRRRAAVFSFFFLLFTVLYFTLTILYSTMCRLVYNNWIYVNINHLKCGKV